MSNPLTSLPPRVRQGLYLLYALAGVALAVLPIYDVDVAREAQVLVILGAAFGLTAASNVPSYTDVVEGDAAPPERGAIDAVTALVVVVLVVVLLLLLGLIPVR